MKYSIWWTDAKYLPYIPDYKATGYIRQPPIFEGKKFGFELLSLY